MFFKRFIAQKVCTSCIVQGQVKKIIPLNNLNKYLHYNASETEVNLNISANNGIEEIIK
jgi:hypothetical protein